MKAENRKFKNSPNPLGNVCFMPGCIIIWMLCITCSWDRIASQDVMNHIEVIHDNRYNTTICTSKTKFRYAYITSLVLSDEWKLDGGVWHCHNMIPVIWIVNPLSPDRCKSHHESHLLYIYIYSGAFPMKMISVLYDTNSVFSHNNYSGISLY